MPALASERARKLNSTQTTVRAGGGSRHHVGKTAPWWTRAAMQTTAGTAMKNSHDSDTTAMPSNRAANGINTMADATVNATDPAANADGEGGCLVVEVHYYEENP